MSKPITVKGFYNFFKGHIDPYGSLADKPISIKFSDQEWFDRPLSKVVKVAIEDGEGLVLYIDPVKKSVVPPLNVN